MNARIKIAAIILLLAAAGGAWALPQGDIVGYWTSEFQPGFNLVSFPVLPDTPTLQAVIGDRLGAVEVTTWDGALGGYRWARYDPQSREWTGNLFLLARGVAYWVNLTQAQEAQRLVVVGHPDQYTQFRWNSLGNGWRFYAPTYGKPQALTALPPADPRDLLLAWDPAGLSFQLAEASAQGWRSPQFERFEADRGYIADLNQTPLPPIGPPIEVEALYDRMHRDGNEQGAADLGGCIAPPEPLIVGNTDGTPICTDNGQASVGDLDITVVRVHFEMDAHGQGRPVTENLSEVRTSLNPEQPGRFKIALGVGSTRSMVKAGDRIFLLARDSHGASTQSNSFEVADADRFITDLSFPQQLNADNGVSELPKSFSIGAPHPNPFNDRFAIEVRLPETSKVRLALYDIMGRLAWEEVNPLSAGIHRVSIHGGNLSAGIYLLNVSTGGAHDMVKVAYLK